MGKTFVVADLHGRFDLLTLALERIEQSENGRGTVVFLGDYIDRGPQSKDVVNRLRAGSQVGWTWICLKGNHEAMMVHCYDNQEVERWIGSGGKETLNSFEGDVPSEIRHWAASLPIFHADRHRIYVHAGVVPEKPLEEQGEAIMLWMRHKNGSEGGFPGKHVVHGHTPNLDGPELFAARTNLDTGAVFSGRLVIGVFHDDTPGGPVSLLEIRERQSRLAGPPS